MSGDAPQTGMNLDPTTLLGGGRRIQMVTTAIAIFLGLLMGAVLMVFAHFMRTNEVDLGLPLVAYGALLDGSLRDPELASRLSDLVDRLVQEVGSPVEQSA